MFIFLFHYVYILQGVLNRRAFIVFKESEHGQLTE